MIKNGNFTEAKGSVSNLIARVRNLIKKEKDWRDRLDNFPTDKKKEGEEMLLQGGTGYPLESKQQKNEAVLERVFAEFQSKDEAEMAGKIENFWKADLRIPQEVITYEVILNW